MWAIEWWHPCPWFASPVEHPHPLILYGHPQSLSIESLPLTQPGLHS